VSGGSRPQTSLPAELAAGLFLRADAERRGVTPGVLRGPGVRLMVRGIYLAADLEPTLAKQLSAHLTLLPLETAVDGVTALQYWGIDVGSSRPYRFVTTAVYQSRRAGLRVRRARQLPEVRDSAVAPVPALVAARTELGLPDLVVAGDWLLRAKLASLGEVRQALADASGRHCRRARRAGELVRKGTESPRETRLRLVIVLCGLPEPECNIDLGDEWFFIGRVDLYLRAWNIGVEYEGDQHRSDAKLFGNDLQRYERLAAAGVLVIRVSKEHLRRPREVVGRIHAALVSRGYHGPAPAFGPEWRSAFEPGS
jgi:hypothetical protein